MAGAVPGDYLVVAITGAQGVGKSKFCEKLAGRLAEFQVTANCISGLGDSIRAMGIKVGSASTTDTIAAIYTAHLERERAATLGVSILDRCTVDALAYVRALGLNTEIENKLYKEISLYSSGRLALVVHLELRGLFLSTGKDHETPELRAEVARLLPGIIKELGVPSLSVLATDSRAVESVAQEVLRLLHT